MKTELFGVRITNATNDKILEFIKNSLQRSKENYYIVTPNPEMIVLSQKNPDFKAALNNAKIALNDGVGLSLAARFLGKALSERSTGVDTMKRLCEMCNDWPITMGFLGGRDGVAEETAECLKKEYPRLQVVFTGEVWDESKIVLSAKGKGKSVKGKEKKPNQLAPFPFTLTPSIDLLFIAFGAPKQELWMAEHVGKIPVKVMMGVGGAFDYISGKVPRAPKLVQSVGLEWLFRLVVQPWRMKRQLALLEFVWMVIKEKFGEE